MPIKQWKIEELIRTIASIKSATLLADFERRIDPKPLFFTINRYDAIPFSRMLLYAAEADKDKWLENCLEQAALKDNCYLLVLGYDTGWHWLEIEAANQKEWISELLLSDNVDDFMVLSHDQKGFLGIIEDEAEYLAFVYKNVEDLPRQ
jgi:hypothetical protein